jgi:hypothetical protein
VVLKGISYYEKPYGMQDRQNREGKGTFAPHILDRSVKTYSNWGADYSHHITIFPPPEFQAFLRPGYKVLNRMGLPYKPISNHNKWSLYMVIRVVEFSSEGYKIGKIFA